jgi:hypothetical protein
MNCQKTNKLADLQIKKIRINYQKIEKIKITRINCQKKEIKKTRINCQKCQIKKTNE